MKNALLFFCLAALGMPSPAQQISISYGRLFSSFDYRDSEGNSLAGLSGTSNNALSFGYRSALTSGKWYFNSGLSLNRYGARGSDPVQGNYYEWDVSYLGANVGIDFEFFGQQNFFANQDGFYFYVKGAISTEFMFQGTQRINSQLYDLKRVEQFDKPVFFLRGGVGANYCVSRRLVVFLQYMVGKSFLIFGTSSGDNEKLRYNSHEVGFGLLLNLVNCTYCNRVF